MAVRGSTREAWIFHWPSSRTSSRGRVRDREKRPFGTKPDGRADDEFMLAVDGSGEKKAGDVDAGNQQNEPDRTQQDQQRLASFSRGAFGERHEASFQT